MEPCIACRVDVLLPEIALTAQDLANAAYVPFLPYLEHCMVTSARVCLPRVVSCEGPAGVCRGMWSFLLSVSIALVLLNSSASLLSCCDSATSF